MSVPVKVMFHNPADDNKVRLLAREMDDATPATRRVLRRGPRRLRRGLQWRQVALKEEGLGFGMNSKTAKI